MIRLFYYGLFFLGFCFILFITAEVAKMITGFKYNKIQKIHNKAKKKAEAIDKKQAELTQKYGKRVKDVLKALLEKSGETREWRDHNGDKQYYKYYQDDDIIIQTDSVLLVATGEEVFRDSRIIQDGPWLEDLLDLYEELKNKGVIK